MLSGLLSQHSVLLQQLVVVYLEEEQPRQVHQPLEVVDLGHPQELPHLLLAAARIPEVGCSAQHPSLLSEDQLLRIRSVVDLQALHSEARAQQHLAHQLLPL